MRLPIPVGVFDQHIAVLGKTRSGKSSVMRLLVEHLLKKAQPVCIIDPKGDWWGLRLSASGKEQGHPIVVFGDPQLAKHVDVAITDQVGADVGELVATGNRPCLLDFGGWTVGARTRFYVDFAAALFKHTRGDRWLVMDEAHNFAPKGSLRGEASAMATSLHWTNRLAAEGLGKGVHLIFASQRPQKVHNDTLTSAETLIAMRVLHPSDRGAVSDWIAAAGDQSGKEVLDSLADLERGEGWAWSPEIKFGPKRIAFPLFSTYDSFKAQGTSAAALKGWGDVDLGELNARLAQVQAQKRANDPATLHQRIRELQHQLQAAPAPAPPAAPRPIITGAQIERLEQLVTRIDAIVTTQARDLAERIGSLVSGLHLKVDGPLEQLGTVRDEITTSLAAIASAHRAHVKPGAPDMTLADLRDGLKPFLPRMTPSAEAVRTAARQPGRSAAEGNGNLAPVSQRILDALAELRAMRSANPPRELVALMAGYTNLTSKAFVNAIGALRSSGYIEYPEQGRVMLTRAGEAHAQAPGEITTPAQMQTRVVKLLGGVSGRILAPLIEAYPRAVAREDVASAAGYTNLTSKAFVNALGRLRTLGFVEYPAQGQVKAAPVLFLEDR